MRFIGDYKIITWVICGYSLCVNKKKNLGTVYQQHSHHLINKLKGQHLSAKTLPRGSPLPHEAMVQGEQMSHLVCQWQQKYSLGGAGVAINGLRWSMYEGGGK